jgi:hypothetical protein
MADRTTIPSRSCSAAVALASLTIVLAIALHAERARADDAGALAGPAPFARAYGARTLTVALFNDVLSPPSNPHRDDDGFTNALRIAAEVPNERGLFRAGAHLQLITERGGVDRVDDGRLYASWQRYRDASPDDRVTLGWSVGVRAVGDLGGSSMQDWAHGNLFTGRRLGGEGTHRLQNRYRDGLDVLGDAGGLVMTAHRLGGPWSVRGGVEAGLSLGTGWFGELHPFAGLAFATRRVDVELRLAAGIYGTDLSPLKMRGGYETGSFETQPSLHLALLGPRWLPTTLEFDLQMNQGNSGQQVGGITLATRF